jgi:hypothetical protein
MLLNQTLEGVLTTTSATEEQFTQVREEYHVQALLGIGNMAIMIRDAIAHYRVIDRSNGFENLPPERCVHPPSLSQTPLATSIRDVPTPFQVDAEGSVWRTWLATRRAEMCTTSFLTSGEWVGYYSYYGYNTIDPRVIRRRQATFDAAMTNIHFQVRENGDVHADGRDSVGTFLFRGAMDGQGLLTGRKYYSATWFYWDLSMTPFGLYGLWSTDGLNSRQLGGTVWLWKKEWVPDSLFNV